MKRTLLTLLTALFMLPALADEGMWLPSLISSRIDDMRSKGFRLTAEDIYSVNQASMKDAVVLFNGGCTGELISPEGLLLTNHHCGYDAIQRHSTVEHDYLTHGFWALSRNEELPNEKLWVRFLVRMEEVTDRIAAGETADEIVKKAEAEAPGYKAAVEQMYYGNQQFLFVYEQFDDVRLVAAAWHIANQNPLGSAAGYGSSFPLDRTMTTRLLEFEDLHYNVVAAQMSRGKSERAAAAAIAAVAATIGRLAMDACLFMSQNFGFISLPDELTTGSSIMPHKKNPDVFEIMRGRCNRLQSVPNEIALLTTNLPVGYHRDLQLMKDILFPATTEIKRTLRMCDFILAHLRVNEHILDDRKYDYLFTVEDVNRMVLAGTPFREAYKEVGIAVQKGEYTPTREVHHTHEGSIGNLCTAEIRRKMERVMAEFE